MKKVMLALTLFSFLLLSCSRGISPFQAANGKSGKCGSKFVR